MVALVYLLQSVTVDNDVNVASGGGYGTQNYEVCTCLLDGPCDGGDHPSDQTVARRGRCSERVDCAHCGAGNHLPAATLEFVLKLRQTMRAMSSDAPLVLRKTASHGRVHSLLVSTVDLDQPD